MTKAEQYICIGCPIGCPLRLEHEGDKIIEISGHDCDRGAQYAKQEFTEPRRDFSTTVAISGARWKRLPVKVNRQIHKERVMEGARIIHELQVEAPVKLGQVLIKNIFGEEGIDVVACRTMDRVIP